MSGPDIPPFDAFPLARGILFDGQRALGPATPPSRTTSVRQRYAFGNVTVNVVPTSADELT